MALIARDECIILCELHEVPRCAHKAAQGGIVVYKILHFSDLHLDTSFASSDLPAAVGSRRRADLRGTLQRILELARERQVDAVTIAGDLYERQYALPETAGFLAQQFASLAPARVFIAPGKSDPYTDDSLYALTRWPSNVSVFPPGALSPVELDPNIHLWGAAHPRPDAHRLFQGLDLDPDHIHLLLLHLSETQHPVASADLDALHAAGFDFALLGGEHSFHLYPKDEPICACPGSPEPLSPQEEDSAHHVVALTIGRKVHKPRRLSVGQWRYVSATIDLTGCTDDDEAAGRVEKSLRSAKAAVDDRATCYVTLSGAPQYEPNLEAIGEQVELGAYIRYRVRLSPPYGLDRLAEERTIRGVVARRLDQRLESASTEEERNLTLNALNLTLRTLEGRGIRPNEVD